MPTTSAGFHWIWSSWLERPEQPPLFLYGCAAVTSRSVVWARAVSVPIGDAVQLKVYQRVVEQAAASSLLADLESGVVRFGSLTGAGAAAGSPVKDKRSLIEPALEHSAARVDSYYTLPDPADIAALGRTTLGKVLSALERELGLPFTTTHAARLGNFEVIHLQPWFDQQQPFLLEVVRSENDIADRKDSKVCVVNRTEEFATQQHFAHLIGRNDGNLVFDRLLILQPGQLRSSEVVASEPVYEMEFRLFTADGETLLHTEHNTYIREVGLNMQAVNREVVVDDELTNKARSTGREDLIRRARKVVGHSSHPSTVSFSPTGGWRQHAQRMRLFAEEAFPKAGEDRWFPRSSESEIAVIEHIDGLINQAGSRKAILADPFFGLSALQRFALRLTKQGLDFTVLASWAKKDPDTDAPFESMEKISRTLDHLRMMINPHLTFINIQGGQDQAFHDRYLVIYPHDGPAQVYMLSNSINNLAARWPVCIARLDTNVGQTIQQYLEGLCEGRDITGASAPNVSYRWTSREART